MKIAVGRWLMLVCCMIAIASAAQDNVLRFLNEKEVVRMAQQKHSDDMKTVFSDGYKGDLPMEKKEQTPISESVKFVVCPGGRYECQDGNTCCPMPSGAWSCCPILDAVCCPDGIRCCPSGFICESSNCTLSSGQRSVPWSVKTAAVPSSVRAVVCPGRQLECPNGNTCCILASGQYGCCPLPNAVCCADRIHCCPSGYTCDTRSCKKSDGQHSVPWSVKTPAVPRETVVTVKCPDGGTCNDGNTCCPLVDGSYGCCPYPMAACCSDHRHCCPQDYTCNLATQSCDKGHITVPWMKKQPALHRVHAVVCPDGQSQCPSGQTCCKQTSGTYGCCPLPRAVCCSDHIHCCPHGTICDVAHSTCRQGQDFIPWEEKTPSLQRMRAVVCPGGESQCPDGETCCKQASGGYGCCPLPDAVCCSDHQHCCPQDYTCNLVTQSCDKGRITVPWMKKQPALRSLP